MRKATRKVITCKMRILTMIVMASVLLMLNVTSIYANDTISSFVSENAPVYDNSGNEVKSGTTKWTSEISGYFSRTADADKGRTNAVSAVYDAYATVYFYSSSDEADIVVGISNLKVSDEVSQQITDITGGLDIKADIDSASETVKPWVPIVNYIIALVVLGVTLLLALYTSSDILWLTFPLFRQKAQEKLSNGTSGMTVKKSSSGECSYRFISDEAVRAYNESTMNGGNKQPYLRYIVYKAWAYILVAVLITILLTGNVEIFLNIGVKLATGFLELIKQL